MRELGLRCKEFRKTQLNKKLTEFCKETNTNVKNVCAFESGKANNINYLFLYFNLCTTQDQKELFYKAVFKDK